jgi:DNA helicase-2/ATP-dependent DNA helicase PcrA
LLQNERIETMIKFQSFTPSPYQQDIFRAIQSEEPAIVISACPGSGKSTTLQQSIRYIAPQKSILMVAFNVDAAKALQSKIDDILRDLHDEGKATPLVESRTIHSLGNATLASAGIRGRATGYKYSKIAREYLRSKNIWDQAVADALGDLLDKVRLTLSSSDAMSLIDLCGRFEIDIDEEHLEVCFNAVPELLQEGVKQSYNGNIDFADMIYLPHVLNLQPRKYDVVMVDEAQDLNKAQRELVLKAVKQRGGQFIAVGDRNQSIYSFAGASNHSIDEIVAATGAKELPLSICYRCPVSAVNLAASIYPGIQAAPNMAQGEIRTIDDKDIADMAQSGDLILSRTTAPLVSLCFDMLRMGKRATIRGRDLGKSLGKLIETIQKFCRQKGNPMSVLNLQDCVYDYLHDQLDTLQGEENELKRANLEDRIDTLLCLYDHYRTVHALSSLERFVEFINEFFKEDKDAQIILSTGHRAKGLEYPRVFIVSSNKLPFARAKTADQKIQERNLMYVMYTRVRYMREVPGSGTLFLGISEV